LAFSGAKPLPLEYMRENMEEKNLKISRPPVDIKNACQTSGIGPKGFGNRSKWATPVRYRDMYHL